MPTGGLLRDDRGVVPAAVAFRRRDDGRVVAGVAGGFADRYGLDVGVVRAALAVLALAGGVGVVVYAAGYAVSERSHGTAVEAWPHSERRTVAFVLMALGVLQLVRSSGVWLGDRVMLPMVVIVSGVVVLANRTRGAVGASPGSSRSRPADPGPPPVSNRRMAFTVAAGVALVAAGFALVSGQSSVDTGVRVAAGAVAVAVLAAGVLVGPWLVRAAQDLAAERRERIRSEERAAMAAHLHDSVLQTLALIQRNAGDARRTRTLARRQERALREWLYGSAPATATSLASAVREMAADVEELYDVEIDVVLVGDRPMDEASAAVVGALREACVNAAKHSGESTWSVFVESGPAGIDAFVRDRGVGFDMARVPAGGHGLASSIGARVERVGGTVVIATAPGGGTEIELTVPMPAAGDANATTGSGAAP
jgi:signal transduction histidine kinase